MLTLSELAHRCAQETARFFQGQDYDPQYCFELFQRAILGHDQAAWDALHTQYQALVAGWVRQHPGFGASDEETQYFVNRAFEKIWVALTPDRFRRFSDLRPLLHYLKMCVHSVIVDYNRSLDRPNPSALAEEPTVEEKSTDPTVEDGALDQVYQQKLWEWINARLQDDKERRVVYGSFVLALKPRELYDQFQGLFVDVEEVYRIKQNVLARLRRDPELQKLLSGHD